MFPGSTTVGGFGAAAAAFPGDLGAAPLGVGGFGAAAAGAAGGFGVSGVAGTPGTEGGFGAEGTSLDDAALGMLLLVIAA